MSNQTFIKKDRISFATNLIEKTVIAPNSNAIFIGANTSVTYDGNSNVISINPLQGITLSNQYIYADGTFISNLAPGNISGWAYFPAKSNVDMDGNNILNATEVRSENVYSSEVYSDEVRTGNTLTDSIYAPNGVGIINVRNNMDMNNNLIGSINQITFIDGSAQNTSADTIVNSTIIGLGTLGYISTATSGSASNWSLYPAISTVDISNNIISNVDTILVNSISSATSGYTDFVNNVNFQNNRIFAVTDLQVDSISANNYGVIDFPNGVNFLNGVDFCNNYTYNHYADNYNDLNDMGQFTGLSNALISYYGYFSYYNSNTPYPVPIAADWWNFQANGTVDMNLNSINNINGLQLVATYPYYANMNLSYSFNTFPDPMNGFTGTYEIFNIDGQPFSLLNTLTGLFTIPNLYTLVFPDYNSNYNTYLYANSNDNDRFYYNIYDNNSGITLSNKAIAQDWSFYAAENTLVMNNNDIISLHGISGYGTYPIEVTSDFDMLDKSILNVSTIKFYDPITPSSNSGITCSNSLLYYNNSNEIIGGTLQYLPQLISFAPFSPKEIPYMALWLDAADFNTFILDSGSIIQWNDKSPNANYFTPTNPPPLYTGPSVIFDGTYFMASINPLTFDTNTYIFMVASINNSSFEMAFALNDINGGDYSLRYVSGGFHNSDSGDTLWPTYYANGYSNGTVNFTQTHIIDGSFNSVGTSIMRLSSDFLERVFLGNINEVIVYNGPVPITNNEILQVRNYIATKWSITL